MLILIVTIMGAIFVASSAYMIYSDKKGQRKSLQNGWLRYIRSPSNNQVRVWGAITVVGLVLLAPGIANLLSWNVLAKDSSNSLFSNLNAKPSGDPFTTLPSERIDTTPRVLGQDGDESYQKITVTSSGKSSRTSSSGGGGSSKSSSDSADKSSGSSKTETTSDIVGKAVESDLSSGKSGVGASTKDVVDSVEPASTSEPAGVLNLKKFTDITVPKEPAKSVDIKKLAESARPTDLVETGEIKKRVVLSDPKETAESSEIEVEEKDAASGISDEDIAGEDIDAKAISEFKKEEVVDDVDKGAVKVEMDTEAYESSETITKAEYSDPITVPKFPDPKTVINFADDSAKDDVKVEKGSDVLADVSDITDADKSSKVEDSVPKLPVKGISEIKNFDVASEFGKKMGGQKDLGGVSVGSFSAGNASNGSKQEGELKTPGLTFGSANGISELKKMDLQSEFKGFTKNSGGPKVFDEFRLAEAPVNLTADSKPENATIPSKSLTSPDV